MSGEYSEAERFLRDRLSQNPNDAEALWQLGLIRSFEGDFDECIKLLQNAVTTDQNHIDARFDLGMTHSMLGMNEEACIQFHEVLRQQPAHEKAKAQIAFSS
jgi:cytochrome c-type biogenesis protein CcmH/NrfG